MVLSIAMAVLLLPLLAGSRRGFRPVASALLSACLSALAVLADSGAASFAAIAGIGAVRMGLGGCTACAPRRPGAVACVAAAAAAAACWFASDALAFGAALALVAVLSGAWPSHGLAGRVIRRSPAAIAEQLSTCVVATFAYLRFVASSEIAFEGAPAVVRVGAAITLLPAVMALVQPDLRGFYRCTVAMHGGMLVAAIGASGRGHCAAGLLVCITLALAMSGLGVMVEAVEDRCGTVRLDSRGGRIAAMPRLGGAFLFLAATGVGLPGTAGFIADDLLLHALWEESVVGSLVTVVASALLAVASLAVFGRVFLGPAQQWTAGDLVARERLAAGALCALLVALGVFPWIVVDPLVEYLRLLGAAPH